MDDRSRGNAPSDFSLSLRAIWWVAFAFFAAMAAVWAFSIVPMGGPDEPAHTVKAVAIVRGHFETRVHKIALDKGPQVPRTRLRVPMGYRVPLLPSCRARDPLTSCEPEFGRGDGEMLTDTYVGAYPPTYYALVGWP